jgi:hypothetical protein
MPRRIPDFPDAFAGWNLISSIGSLISVGATVLFLYIVYDLFTNTQKDYSNYGLIKTKTNTDINTNINPWVTLAFFISDKIFSRNTVSGNTLEFSVISPIPTHVYNTLPILGDNLSVINVANVAARKNMLIK